MVVGAASRAYLRLFGSVDEVRAVRRPARASARVSKARMREALVRALASFEDALARPRAGAFR